MPANKSTLIRLRTIDACLCRRQKTWTLEDLRQACEDALADCEGIDGVSLRTIQRDIQLMRSDKLGYNAPIIVRQRKYYTYEDPDYSITQMPLSKWDYEELSSAMDIIKHYQGFAGMSGADDILTRLQDRIESNDDRQIIYIETNQRLKGLQFLSPLYESIKAREAIVVDYQSFQARRDSYFNISPYLLKEFNNRWFLIGYHQNKNKVMTLALDRILDVNPDKKNAFVENTFFSPDDYLSQMIGVTRELKSVPELITLKVDESQAPYILTKPLHSSQQVIKTHDDGSITITLNVIRNLELEHLIFGFGEHIDVIAPISLRQRMAQKAFVMAAKYKE